MYERGHGVALDCRQAVQWYLRAATQGYARSQTSLARIYRTGSGVARSDTEAAMWLRRAAVQGDVEAQNLLGTM